MPEGLERIGVHLPSLIAYTINFAILLVLLHLVAYRPFLRHSNAGSAMCRTCHAK